MRRAIIHIGMPRTGSTSLQHVLATHRAGLEGAGILYPDLTPRSAAHEPHISHQHFGEALDKRRPKCERIELLAKLSSLLSRHEGDVAFLSYEDFIQQQPRFRVPELLNNFFAKHGFTAEALVVLKPQSEHLNSIYTHRSQMMREYQSFARFAPAYNGTLRFEYDKLIEPWMRVFSGRVRAVPVRDRRTDAPIILRILDTLDLADRVVPLLRTADTEHVMNRSPGPVAVEASRRMRAMRMHARLRVLPRQVMRFVEREAAKRGLDGEKFYGVPTDLRDRMESRYRTVNERFARTVWQKSWDEVVSPSAASPVNELAGAKIEPATETNIQEVIGLTAEEFGVTPKRSIFDRPINGMIANVDTLQRLAGYSRWRVL